MKKTKAKSKEISERKRSYLSQADVPSMSLDEALRIPGAIQDNYAGAETTPLKVAKALDVEPGGSKLRMLSGAAVAYGLITGGAQAAEIGLTDLARRIVKPKIEGDDLVAKREAFLGPRVVGEFLRKYDNSQLPRGDIAQNVLEEMWVPTDKADQTLSLIMVGAHALGLTQDIKGKTYVDLAGVAPPDEAEVPAEGDSAALSGVAKGEESLSSVSHASPGKLDASKAPGGKISVFISHGKNQQIMQQLKEILTFGKFDPVVSIEKESTGDTGSRQGICGHATLQRWRHPRRSRR